MSEIIDTLNVVLQKVASNRVNVAAALAQATASASQIDPDTMAAADVLLKKFGSPQAAGQILANVYQLDALADTQKEMDAMIAGLQSVLSDEAKIEAAAAQLAANTASLTSPLPPAGTSGGTDTVVDAGSTSEAATPAA